MDASPAQQQSLFRTRSWVQSWIDVWGRDASLTLVDLGGSGHPLEHVYLTRTRLKGLIPARTLCLAGTGFGPVSTPRSEYNTMDALVESAGGPLPLLSELKRLNWSQWCMPDLVEGSDCERQLATISRSAHWPIHRESTELAYAATACHFPDYKSSLSGNTRRVYFNQRGKLSGYGGTEREDWAPDRLDPFIDLLNDFHRSRWGTPCFSDPSRRFFHRLFERLPDEGGIPRLEVMRLDGKPVSVLMDIDWRGTRHNIQSGFSESAVPGVSLGALHMGYAIEAALSQGHCYDFLAGRGKSRNYKASVANRTTRLKTLILQKPGIALLRQVQTTLQKRRKT